MTCLKHLALCSLLPVMPAAAFCQDSLMYHHGAKVTSVAQWESRRESIRHLALEHIYGFMPPAPEWDATTIKEVLLAERNLLYKEIVIQLYKDNSPTRSIRLSVFIPAHALHPVPVVLALNKCGNHTVSAVAEVSAYDDRQLHPKCVAAMQKSGGGLESLRGMQANYWALDTLLKRGYAFATFHESDIAADTNSLEQGIFPYYPELKTDSGWHIISAWAWGLQRAVDYLATDKRFDPSRIILFGHSRRGKAALLAAALDGRVAMVAPHQSGTGGMALGRKHPMESIRRINKNFPFWFNTKFKTYSRNRKSLPLDQHYLAALMAPRPLIETTGKWDVWSSYWLSRKTLRLASPAYALYDVPGLTGKGKISRRKSFGTDPPGHLVQVRRPYRHTMNADYWNFILDFADLKLISDKK